MDDRDTSGRSSHFIDAAELMPACHLGHFFVRADADCYCPRQY